jgi:DNA processing protein
MNFTLEYIIALLQLPKVGRKTAFKVINDCKSNINDTKSFVDLVSTLHTKKFRLKEFSSEVIMEALRKGEEIIERAEKNQITIISFFDELYPEILKTIKDPPLLLTLKGNISALNKDAVAIIGTREISLFGEKVGIRWGEYFTEYGFNIVSGLALGCDTAAHLGCLKASGVTTAVLAHGLDMPVYPKQNAELAERILDENGLLISEYMPGVSSRNNYFVERDRIQAGLSKAVLVIETDVKGGTMHTVRYCLDYGRTLACLNHPLDKREGIKLGGNQELITQGKAVSLSEKADLDNLRETLSFCELKDISSTNVIQGELF